jgi:hypothetical protein
MLHAVRWFEGETRNVMIDIKGFREMDVVLKDPAGFEIVALVELPIPAPDELFFVKRQGIKSGYRYTKLTTLELQISTSGDSNGSRLVCVWKGHA